MATMRDEHLWLQVGESGQEFVNLTTSPLSLCEHDYFPNPIGDYIAMWKGSSLIDIAAWRCPYCGVMNLDSRQKCGDAFTGCGAPRRE